MMEEISLAIRVLIIGFVILAVFLLILFAIHPEYLGGSISWIATSISNLVKVIKLP